MNDYQDSIFWQERCNGCDWVYREKVNGKITNTFMCEHVSEPCSSITECPLIRIRYLADNR